MFSGKDFTPAKINEVQENSPAYIAGVKKNDLILSIDNNKVKSILDVSTYINTSTSNKISFTVLRNDNEISFLIEPTITTGKDSFGNELKKDNRD